MTAGAGWDDAANVLAVRLDALGDVLMTTPALRAVKESRPGRRVTLLTSPAGAAAARLVPAIDEVLVYEAPWMKATAPRADSRPELEMAGRLRRAGFDAAAIFTVYSQNPLPAAFLCHLADIPRRLAHCRENPYGLLTDWVREPEPDSLIRHEVRRQLDLVAAVGARTADERMALRIPEAARRRVGGLVADRGIDPESPWVLVHPGASAPSRRYPPEGFAAAARLLAGEAGCPVLLTGSESERALVEEVRGAMGVSCPALIGGLDLGELAALIERAAVLIANNSGPAHVAAAVGTPVVDLYALTNPQHTPWGVPHRVLNHDVPCKYCYKSVCPEGHHDCLRRVPPDDVARAALELIEEVGATRSVGVLGAHPGPLPGAEGARI
ncbi:MAG TPA: glycosyltransferase family 9 protein [Isosphaeraceae bacterium]